MRTFVNAPKVLVIQEIACVVERLKFRGIVRYAQNRGPWNIYSLFGRVGEPDPARLIAKGRYDGIIVGQMCVEKSLDFLRRQKCPIVLLDKLPEIVERNRFLRKCPSVSGDNVRIGRMAAEYLLGKGIPNFAYVNEPLNRGWSIERGAAFAVRVADAGFVCPEFRFNPACGGKSATDASRLASFIRSLPKPVAVFAAADVRAIEVIRLCGELGFRVPEDVAVLGVDNAELLCDASWPHCSSIATDAEGGGEVAARLLDDAMRRRECVVGSAAVYAPTGVVERESTRFVGNSPSETAKRVREFVRLNATEQINVADVVAELGISRRTAEQHFSAGYGRTILEEIREARLRTAEAMLRTTDLPVGEVVRRCGYQNDLQLRRDFRQFHGMSATAWRERADPGRLAVRIGTPACDPAENRSCQHVQTRRRHT